MMLFDGRPVWEQFLDLLKKRKSPKKRRQHRFADLIDPLEQRVVLSARVMDAPVALQSTSAAPVLTSSKVNRTYTENGAPLVVLNTNATVKDVDSPDLISGRLTVSFTENGASSDRLTILHQGTKKNQIGVSDSAISFGGVEIGTFTGGTGTTPLVVTFTSTAATPAAVQALVRRIAFHSVSEDPPTALRTVSFVLTDGDGGTSNPLTQQISVRSVNDAPVLTTELVSRTFDVGSGPLTILPATSTVGDVDSLDLLNGKLTVKMTGAKALDRLEIPNQGTGAGRIGVSGSNITFGGALIGTFTGGVGTAPLVVTFTTTAATPSAAQALLRSLTYRSLESDPAFSTRTVSFVLTDGDGGTSNTITQLLSVKGVNKAPQLTGSTTTRAYTENGAPLVVLNTNATVKDVDSPDLISGRLTVSFTENGASSDRLTILHQGTKKNQIGVSDSAISFGGVEIGTFTGGIGTTPLVVTFTSTAATPAAVQALVRRIAFHSVSEDPPTALRTVSFVLTDGDGGTSNPLTQQISVRSVNDAPVLATELVSRTFDVGSGPLTILPATSTVGDVDSLDLLNGKLTVKMTGAKALDRLEIPNQGTGAGRIGVSGSNITFGGALIGTFTGGVGTAPLVVTFTTTAATPSAAQALLRSLTYRSLESDPAFSTRTVSFVLTDGDGGTSNTITQLLSVKGVNKAPQLTGSTTTRAYTENGAPLVILNTNATVKDVDSPDLISGRLTVSFTENGASSDRLTILHQGTGKNQIGVSGAAVSFGGVEIGTFTGGTGTTPLVVTFTSTAATPAAVQALVRRIAFHSVSEDPPTALRTVSFVLTDGDGGTSNPLTQQISVRSVNDAPVLATELVSRTFDVGSGPLTILPATSTVGDVDSLDLLNGKLTVKMTGAKALDRLEIPNQGTGAGRIGVSGSNITFGGALIGTFTGGVGTAPLVVTFTTTAATPSAAQALLRSLTYRSLESDPAFSTRTVSFVLTDGDGGTSNTITQLLSVKGVNKAPQLTGSTTTRAYTENGAPLVILNTNATVKDVDSPDLISGRLTVSFTENGASSDRLTILHQGTGKNQIGVSGAAVSFGGVEIGTFTGGTGTTPLVVTFTSTAATPAAVQALVRRIAFHSVSEDPPTALRTVSFVLTDGDGGTSNTLTQQISVRSVNDAPVLRQIGDRVVSDGYGPEMIWLMASDPDSPSVQYRYEILSPPRDLPGTVELDGDLLTLTAREGKQGTLRIRVTASDGVSQATSTFNVHFNRYVLAGYEISNPILAKWLDYGGEEGIGRPTGAAVKQANGNITQRFTGGRITWEPTGEVLIDDEVTKRGLSQSSNVQSSYQRRPTLVVLTQGASTAGYFEYAWMTTLRDTLTRDLQAAGGQVHVMTVLWDSMKPNDVPTESVAGSIRSWLSSRTQQWDVLLVGHSRGAIFNQELTRQIGTHSKIASLQHIMLDPTAAVPQGDQYPGAIAAGVDNAVVYDDGYVFIPGAVRDGLPVNGARYERVNVPGMGYQDFVGSHNVLATWYAKGESAEYQRDLAWLRDRNPVIASRPYVHEWLGNGVQTIYAPAPDGHRDKIDIGFDTNQNGDFRGWITIFPLGGVDVTIGKSGLDVQGGVVLLGSGGVSINDQGLAINVNALNFIGGSVRIGTDETRIDLNAFGLNINLFGKGAGIYVGGKKLDLARDLSLPSSSIAWENITSTGKVTETFQNGMRIARNSLDQAGNYVQEQWNSLGTYVLERGNALGKTFVETRDQLGRLVSRGIESSGKWISQQFDTLGNLIAEWKYFGKFGSTLQQYRTWLADGTITRIEDYAAAGHKVAVQWLNASSKWISQELDAVGNVLKQLNYFGKYGSQVQQLRTWLSNGTFTRFEEYAAAGYKTAVQWLDSSSKWIAQELNQLGRVLSEWAYFGKYGSQLEKFRSWNASGVLTRFDQYASNGVKTAAAWLNSSSRWVSQQLNAAGKVVAEWFYYGGYGSQLAEWATWNASGVLTRFEQYASNGVKTAVAWLNSSSRWVSQQLNAAGKVVSQWFYYGVQGSQLAEWATWNASGAVTNLQRFTANGVKTLEAFISTTGDWVERVYSNGVQVAEKIWNSAGRYLGDRYKNFTDAISQLDPTTKDWWPF
ncbi:hypothetical protein [Planctomicrobium sp. SH664]|uniref:hypothetical protein n=1 Tax=Planctomicrobium sp. SH664 TaxID=3448125 RepID=UPI003F5AF2EF